MERLLKNQQIPLVQVIDPISGQQYYAPESAIYTNSTDTNPVILKSVVVDQATSASYFSGSITNAVSSSYATTASYLDRPVTSASYAITASYANYAETASSALNAQDILIRVLNQSGNPIAKGIVVHITASGNSSDIPRIITASWENDSNSANTLGITNQSIANGAEGFVMTEGVLKGINTQAFQSGQLIYLGATGSIIGYAPQAPLHSVRLGQVVRHQSNNGSIYVRIDNGYELEELHDVLIISASSGDLLIRSSSVWINSKQLSGSYSLTGSLTISGSSTFTNIGPAIFSGSVISTNGFTGSFQGTSSYALTHETTVSTYICTGRLGTNQIIFSSSDNTIKFSRDIDPNGWLSGTPNFRVTPTYPGYYSVSAGVLFENPNDTTSQLNLQGRKNGNTFAIFQTPTNNITEQSLTFTKTIYLNGTTDYIDFSVYQGTPANISLITGSALSSGTWFSMNLITM